MKSFFHHNELTQMTYGLPEGFTVYHRRKKNVVSPELTLKMKKISRSEANERKKWMVNCNKFEDFELEYLTDRSTKLDIFFGFTFLHAEQ